MAVLAHVYRSKTWVKKEQDY